MNLDTLARLHRDRRFGVSNGGWAYDAYPELETLDAGRAITIAVIEGPAVITQIHSTQHFMADNWSWSPDVGAQAARGVVLEVYYDDAAIPSVRAPLADFFADGCGGRAVNFSSLFVEKAPGAYNCYLAHAVRSRRARRAQE
ncbi:MAG: DUF2961 domain-containing protein [Anaerolineae bacterium]|nr:DUF2961 domain-containing protein [Anaerolineae bacterium]